VFSHFGGGLAGYKERIALSAYRFKLPRAFEEYFDRLYFDMAGFESSPIALRCALEGIKPERMVFATGYPQNFNNSDPTMGKSVDGIGEYVETIRKLPLSKQTIDGMLGETAAPVEHNLTAGTVCDRQSTGGLDAQNQRGLQGERAAGSARSV
jgi:hypothetical protein